MTSARTNFSKKTRSECTSRQIDNCANLRNLDFEKGLSLRQCSAASLFCKMVAAGLEDVFHINFFFFLPLSFINRRTALLSACLGQTPVAPCDDPENPVVLEKVSDFPSNSTPGASCVTDDGQADDQPGQKDLNQFCRQPMSGNYVKYSFSFDDTNFQYVHLFQFSLSAMFLILAFAGAKPAMAVS